MVILTTDLDRILETDFEEGWIRCEPGVVLATVQQLATASGWRYVPDPSSYQVCTLGGNVAENAGGPHALGGGPTSNYVTALELVLPHGGVVTLDSQQPWRGGLDLRALLVGSEGTLGAVASVTLRLVRAPESEGTILATFAHQQDALSAVLSVFDSGLLPYAMDMLTGGFIPGRNDYVDDSVLFISLQGYREEVSDQAARLSAIIRVCGGTDEMLAAGEFHARRARLVTAKVRNMTIASGRPRYYLFDAVAPRSRLADLMTAIRCASVEHGLPVLNTFHAGDGNVHPTPFYDPRDTGHRERLLAFSADVLRQCHRLGGSLSGEHGIGLEKRELMREVFPPEVLAVMRGVKWTFDPVNICNPGKVAPVPQQPPEPAVAQPSEAVSQWPRAAGLRVHWADAFVELGDGGSTFREVGAALAGSAYELAYVPLGGDLDDEILAAFDTARPALREPGGGRAGDLVVGASLWQAEQARVLVLGGRCVKDVAGYELRKLVHGGRGRLGELSGLRLRITPRPTDSYLAHGAPLTIEAAIHLCRRIHAAGLPFSYLGVLAVADDTATVTGRIEVRGGSADRHITALHALDNGMEWNLSHRPCWQDPVMSAMADGKGGLLAIQGMPWTLPHILQEHAQAGVPAFASIGHGCMWSRGVPPAQGESSLTRAVIDAFRAVP